MERKLPSPPNCTNVTANAVSATKSTATQAVENIYNVYIDKRRNGLSPHTAAGTQITNTSHSDVSLLTSAVKGFGPQRVAVVEPILYTCDKCQARFSVKSLLIAHKQTHSAIVKPNRVLKRYSICEYCDREFDLERTLHLHHMSYCSKIAPAQRRKLPYTEMMHEKKPPLPDVFHSRANSSPSSSRRRAMSILVLQRKSSQQYQTVQPWKYVNSATMNNNQQREARKTSKI